MNSYQKYLKYKKKYIELKNLIGGNNLEIMPQLCLGTSNWTNKDELKYVIKQAIKVGYRHFDGAIIYANQSLYKADSDEYYEGFKSGILEGLQETGISREDIWITFKSPSSDEIDVIKTKLSELKYIDLWLYHLTRNDNNKKVEPYLTSGFILNWGTSNEYHLNDYSDEILSKNLHTNQIQARPDSKTKTLIEYLNKLDINVMLFSPISAINEDTLIDIKYGKNPHILNSIIKDYLHEYVYDKKNVLMIGSISGSSLEENFRLFTSKEVISEEENVWLQDNYLTWELRDM